MALKTNIDVIIQKMCNFKRDNDKEGFEELIDSIRVGEWQDLREFADSLKSLSESELKRKPRVIK